MVPPKVTGLLLMLIAVVIALIYLVGLVVAPDTPIGNTTLGNILVRYTVLIIMLIISAILGYMGYLIFIAPAPRPIEELVKEYKEYARA